MSKSTGHIQLTSLAMLANMRVIDPKKGEQNVLFYVNLNINDDGKTPTLGLLRYFFLAYIPHPFIKKIGHTDFT